MGELVEDDELQVAAHADVRCVLDAAEAAEVTRTRRLVVAEDDLEVRQAQLSRPKAGHRVIEPCLLLAARALHDDRGLTPKRRCSLLPDHTRHDEDGDAETRRDETLPPTFDIGRSQMPVRWPIVRSRARSRADPPVERLAVTAVALPQGERIDGHGGHRGPVCRSGQCDDARTR